MEEFTSLKVLWIEDSLEDRQTFLRLTKKVSNYNFKITWADSVTDALKSIGVNNFDIVITDLGLPDESGINVLNKFKDFTDRYPFVVLTGYDDDSLLNDVSAVKVFDYLVKNDLTPGVLRRSIRYAIGRFCALQEQEKLALQLRKAQRVETLGKLMGGIAHDFNNKLAIILGNVDILHHSENLSNSAIIRIEEIKQTIQKSVDLVKQLLTSGRRQELNKKRVNLSQIINDSLNLLSSVIRPEITLDFSAPKIPLYANVDSAQIDQMVMNLVLNAQDAILKKEGNIQVKIESVPRKSLKELLSKNTTEDKFIKIKVVDNGQGIDEKTKSKILEPFFTTKPEHKGIGLGLSVVDGVINQHKGLLEIKSKLGKGTCFEIYLPQMEGYTKKSTCSKKKKNNPSEHTVLFVEDEKKLIKLVRTLLEIRGLNVISAENGAEGLKIFKKSFQKIDVILSDMIMPDMNGKELMEEIRKIDNEMGFVFVSGYSRKKLTVNGILPKRTFFHSKPYNIDEVLKSLLKLVKGDKKTLRKKAS